MTSLKTQNRNTILGNHNLNLVVTLPHFCTSQTSSGSSCQPNRFETIMSLSLLPTQIHKTIRLKRHYEQVKFQQRILS